MRYLLTMIAAAALLFIVAPDAVAQKKMDEALSVLKRARECVTGQKNVCA